MIRPATSEDIGKLRWQTRNVDHHGWAEKCRAIAREAQIKYAVAAPLWAVTEPAPDLLEDPEQEELEW